MSAVVLMDYFEKMLFILLIGLSIWSVSVMFDRYQYFKKQRLTDIDKIRALLREGKFAEAEKSCAAESSVFGFVLSEGLKSAKIESKIDRAVSSAMKDKRLEIEKGLPVLATLGANAPFIGLLGTVFGIIRSFAHLGDQAGASSVMSGVSQALYATAAGLFVAIPAVVAFNYFSKQMRTIQIQVEAARDLYISRLKE